ncbi:MAG: YjjG family noncanonical pyrimidine nucleotidase [Oscillibacter sp.]|nr:YjjG family noncanonical pyrimidine nucleotidase [Oscillibacter sp.]
MLKHVFLDLDDTLLNFSAGEAIALRQTLREFGFDAPQEAVERYHQINIRYWQRLETGELVRPQVLTGRFAELLALYSLPYLPEAVNARYEQLLSAQHIPLPGSEALLQTLSRRYSLYLASNGAASVQYPRLDASGFRKYFTRVFISEELGADKPSRAYFEKCFAAIPDFRREEAVMIGDSLTSDVLGGINAGLRTVWTRLRPMQPRADIRPDYTVASLAEIPPLLETL